MSDNVRDVEQGQLEDNGEAQADSCPAAPNAMASSVVSSCSSNFSTASNSSINLFPQSSNAMSEKVASLAAAIYQELEAFIKENGGQNIRTLMSLVISTLESLDLATQEREEQATEIELLKEDREQLLTQWERERQLRKRSEEKYLLLEDALEEQRRFHEDQILAGERSLKIANIRLKNVTDHVTRLEEKEAEAKGNYARLREKYNELFRLHCEHVERIKASGQNADVPAAGHVRQNQGYGGRNSCDSSPGLDSSASSKEPPSTLSPGSFIALTSKDSRSTAGTSVAVQLPQRRCLNSGISPGGNGLDIAFVEFDDKSSDFDICEARNFEEDAEACSACEEMSTCDSADGALNSSFFGMTKEVDKLISENNDLLATKNALNVLKDDLIEKVNELTGKLTLAQKELESLEEERHRNLSKILQLEADLRSARSKRSELEEAASIDKKFFTRAEMSRVLAEKNMYKQKFMDLEDAVRWQEIMRSNRTRLPANNGRKRARVWQLFSTLFAPTLITTQGNTKSDLEELTDTARSGSRRHASPATRELHQEKTATNDWIAPNCCSFPLPVYINKTAVPQRYMEKVRCFVNFRSRFDQMWLAGPSRQSSRTSTVLLVDSVGERPDSSSEAIQILRNFRVNFIVSALCYVPVPSDGRSLYSHCEYCSREKKLDIHPGGQSERIDTSTVWLGSQDGFVSVWHADEKEEDPSYIRLFSLNSPILAMQYKQGAVVCGLSNGSVAVLHVNEDGLWRSSHHLISMSAGGDAVRALCFMEDGRLWAGVRNQISCVDNCLTVDKVFGVHPRHNSQIRNIVSYNDIAVVAMRLDSTLRIFHCTSTEHLQDVDLDPLERIVVSLSSGHTGLSLVRVTAIDFGPDSQLYVGTSNGNIISIPSIWSEAGKCGSTSNHLKSKLYLLDHHATVSVRSHKKDVQCLCSLRQGTSKLVCSFGCGYQFRQDLADQHTAEDSSSPVLYCMTWRTAA